MDRNATAAVAGLRPPEGQSKGEAGTDAALIDPGKDWQDGASESFNGKFHGVELPVGSNDQRHC
jgi:hypothetical protein